MWPILRAQQLAELTDAAFSKPITRFAFVPAGDNDFIDYLPAEFSADFRSELGTGWEYAEAANGLAGVDAVIVTAHGSNLSHPIWELRGKCQPGTLIVVWFWDNHLTFMNDLATALAADYVFPSHKYAASHLVTPAAVLGAHVPACSAQWTRDQAARYFAEHAAAPRQGKVLVNYVDYPFSPRSQLLRRLQAEVPEAEVLLMEPGERSRYFGKSRSARFKEWVEYKSTLILPVDRDLSTRVFDALLAGQVLLVPKHIADFDEVIPPAVQRDLGVVRLADLEIGTIRQAASEAERTFDAMGFDGALARHRYVLDNHMMVHRVRTILDTLKAVANRNFRPGFVGNAKLPYGLHLTTRGT